MAIEFDNASSQGLRIDDYSAAIPSAQFTVSCWVYMATSIQWGTIVKQWGDSIGGFVHLGLEDTSGNVSVYLQEEDDTQIGPVTSDSAISSSTWTHVAALADGSNLRLYIDGSENGTALAYDGTLNTDQGPALGIGAKPDNAGTGWAATNIGHWDGYITEVGIWDTGLAAAEISSLAAAFPPSKVGIDNLIDYWRLIETGQLASAWSTRAFTAYGSPTNIGHPRIYSPSAQIIPFPPAAAPASTRHVLFVR